MTTTPVFRSMDNKRTILIFLAAAAVLNMVPMGVYAGILLSLMILATLLRADDQAVANRRILIGLALVVLVVNIAFLLGYLQLYR